MKYLIMLLTLNCFAMTQEQGKDLFSKYLNSIQQAKEEKFKSITSKSYYSDLKSKDQISEMFKLNKGKNMKIRFDLEIKKAQSEKDVFFVKIKDKKAKYYNHNWFRVIKKSNKFLIDGTRHFD